MVQPKIMAAPTYHWQATPTTTCAHFYLRCLELCSLALHEFKHVEKAVVSRGRECLLQPQSLDEARVEGRYVRWGNAAQALHQQCSQSLVWKCDGGDGE